VTWYDEKGARQQRSFSTLKYGEAGARRLAIELRREMIAETLLPAGARRSKVGKRASRERLRRRPRRQ